MKTKFCIAPLLRNVVALKTGIVLLLAFFSIAVKGLPAAGKKHTSTQEEAIAYLSKINRLDSSTIWTGINPTRFFKNLRKNIEHPITVYPGEGTYFCAYSALTYLMLQDDPLGYARFVVELYRNGEAMYRETYFKPSLEVKKEAGLLNYKGVMDINPADQMWYLTMADHFKGYLNTFNRIYDPGDENNFWASVNYAKFNRMAKRLLFGSVTSKGSDLIRPKIKDLYGYLYNKLHDGNVVLYINNRIVHKKNHVSIKLAVPTHFIVVEKITRIDDLVTLVYWDNGAKTLIQLSPAF
ncbi:MAG: hypothetical protein IPL84_13295 [Chitinophagaceae bacterium]|nr:hypothetical protein [Chitinophagaceae bacterium]